MQAIRFVRRNSGRALTAASAVLATLVVALPASSFAPPPPKMMIDNDKAEACIEELRETQSQDFGSYSISGTPYKRYGVGDTAYSKKFSTCMDNARVPAKSDYSENVYRLVDDHEYRSEGDVNALIKSQSGRRYVVLDVYMHKSVVDNREKIIYQLVRIAPAGSIEAKGFWNGEYKDSSTCKNSYGDPCGTPYRQDDKGMWVRLR